MKFYRCSHCHNLVVVLYDGGVTPRCCGDDMDILQAGVTDGAVEKHVPVVSRDGNKVTVKIGSEPHPMTPEHHVEWIAIEYDNKYQIAKLSDADMPEATFVVDSNSPITAYEHCNLHGLWKSDAV
ncbi:superoxide reductase [Alphaproteobacteria bacterium]|nr:superoxide reductase [Alphaproteobacteria bacterium]